MSRKNRVTFDAGSKEWILGIFSKTVDSEGFIIEKKDKSRVQTPEGIDITLDELSFIKKGSEKFITGDLTSFMKLVNDEI